MRIEFIFALVILVFTPIVSRAQLLRKSDYGAGVTIAIYQFDESLSKNFPQVTTLKQTLSTAEEEIDYITRSFGVEDLKVRHVRTVGLREGEAFTDTQPMNDKALTFTITPRIITKSDVTFDLIVRYDEKVLMDFKSVTANSYETVMLRGGQGDFGVREFAGPNGPEKTKERRSLLATVTPSVTTARSLQNKPTEISRPTDQFGSKVELGENDSFIMPALMNRVALKFPPGARVNGSITLEGIVTPEGRVTNVKVLDTPDSALNQKAIEAFRQYRFNPPKLNGRPTYATYRETMVLSKQGPL